MGTGRLTSLVLGTAIAGVVAVAGVGCGDEDSATSSKEVHQKFVTDGEARRAAIDKLVHEGKLPPVARLLINPDGSMNLDFIETKPGKNDVVRSGPDGTTGKKLAWDLNQNGKIDRSERTITENELYKATVAGG
jgi:hypothetical protein